MITARDIRRLVLEQSKRAHVGHIGCSLSVADILAVLYSSVLRLPSPTDPTRDRFVLSKGHAALGLYAALHLKGWVSSKELNRFCSNGSLLGVHPSHEVPGVEYSTGSLGMGLSFATGGALALRLQENPARTFVLLSDAECNEGSVWEAIMFAAHHRLSSVTAIVDVDGQQAFGSTKEVLDMSPMGPRWASFGWRTLEVDGNSASELERALSTAPDPARPTAVVAKTTFGKGVSFMENALKWHYFPMSDADFEKALSELRD